VLREVKSGLQQKVVDLDLCWNAEHLGVRESSPIQTAITIALFSEGVEYELSLCNLPRAAAANTFAAMEALALKSLQDRQLSGSAVKQQGEQVYQLAKRFPDEVNAYAKTKSGAPHFIWLGECGGLGPPVTIKTKPPGATVSYISLFSYKLCEALHVNAEDTDKCDGWVTALAVTEDLVGKYRYLAVWPDGKQRRGAFSVNNKTTLTISQ
jgi:hypothetical protein